MEQKQPLQQMALGDLDSYMQKIKLNNQVTLYTKINSRWTKDLNMSRDSIKVLEENIGKKISDIPCINIFNDTSPRARVIKERINKWDLIKLKSFCRAKENSFTMRKRTNSMGKHICQ